MNYYAINAYENLYQGLHGIYTMEVIMAPSDDAAERIAEDLSYEVIESYVEDELREGAEEEGISEDDDEYSAMLAEDIAYDIYKLDNSKIPKGVSLSSLTNDFWDDPDEFIKKYGVDEEEFVSTDFF